MEDEFRHLVRISRKDVDGNKTFEYALTDIKGIGLSLSRTIGLTLGFDLNAKIGYIKDELDADAWIESKGNKEQYKGWDGMMYPYYTKQKIEEIAL